MARIPGKAIVDNTITATQIADATEASFKSVGKYLVLPITTTITTDNAQLSTTVLTETPVQGSLELAVHTIPQQIGDGVKTTDAYVSGDNGVSARAHSAIVAGDKVYLNAVIAQITATTGDLAVIKWRV